VNTKKIPHRTPFLLAKYLYNCSKFSSSFPSYQFSSSYKRLVIYFLLKEKKRERKQKQKKKMDKGPNEKRRKKEKKDIYATKFPFIFKIQKR
jgi:hypothetical protein